MISAILRVCPMFALFCTLSRHTGQTCHPVNLAALLVSTFLVFAGVIEAQLFAPLMLLRNCVSIVFLALLQAL